MKYIFFQILPEYTESMQASRERDLRQLGPQVRNSAHKIIVSIVYLQYFSDAILNEFLVRFVMCR